MTLASGVRWASVREGRRKRESQRSLRDRRCATVPSSASCRPGFVFQQPPRPTGDERRDGWKDGSAFFVATSTIRQPVIRHRGSPQGPLSKTSRTIGSARIAARAKTSSRRWRTSRTVRAGAASTDGPARPQDRSRSPRPRNTHSLRLRRSPDPTGETAQVQPRES